MTTIKCKGSTYKPQIAKNHTIVTQMKQKKLPDTKIRELFCENQIEYINSPNVALMLPGYNF